MSTTWYRRAVHYTLHCGQIHHICHTFRNFARSNRLLDSIDTGTHDNQQFFYCVSLLPRPRTLPNKMAMQMEPLPPSLPARFDPVLRSNWSQPLEDAKSAANPWL